MLIGYAGGVFDLFHVGHVNFLKNAKAMCDRLIVGVSTDGLAATKFRRTVIPFEERVKVVEACRYADIVIPQETFDKVEIYHKLKYDVLFVGDDWFNKESWRTYEEKLKVLGVKIIFFPYTINTSSTLINDVLNKLRNEPPGDKI